VKKKKKLQRVALLETLLVSMLLGGVVVVVLVWAAKSEDSQLAASIRQLIGIPAPKPAVVVAPQPAPTPQVVIEEAPPPADEPEPFIAPEPEPIPQITFAEVAAQKHLWPRQLTLKLSVQVLIRYNGKDYGYMEFPRGRTILVDGVLANGEIFCQIDGNYLSLSVYETDFYGWFKATHGERYQIQPVVVDFGSRATAPYKLGTEKGDAAFWAEMRIWCQQNYDSVSLSIEEDTLVFKWLPKEDAPIDFPAEAREVARNYLLKRAKYGGRENYAACEIRHPTTGEVLGASAIFIPRL
jgi:hypothetical protein